MEVYKQPLLAKRYGSGFRTNFALGANNLQHNNYDNSDDWWYDFWSTPFFIRPRPNLKLDDHISYDLYQDGRIDCFVNITNEEPTGRWRKFKDGNGSAYHCQPVVTLTNSEGISTKRNLLWLIVYDGESDPSHIELEPSVSRKIIFAVISPTNDSGSRTIRIPTGPRTSGPWQYALLPSGEYNVDIRVTRRGTSCHRDYGKIRLPDTALQATNSLSQ